MGLVAAIAANEDGWDVTGIPQMDAKAAVLDVVLREVCCRNIRYWILRLCDKTHCKACMPHLFAGLVRILCHQADRWVRPPYQSTSHELLLFGSDLSGLAMCISAEAVESQSTTKAQLRARVLNILTFSMCRK